MRVAHGLSPYRATRAEKSDPGPMPGSLPINYPSIEKPRLAVRMAAPVLTDKLGSAESRSLVVSDVDILRVETMLHGATFRSAGVRYRVIPLHKTQRLSRLSVS